MPTQQPQPASRPDDDTAHRDGQAAIVFSTPDFVDPKVRLMGKQIANSAFVRAFVRYGDVDRHHAVCRTRADFLELARAVDAAGGSAAACVQIHPSDHAGLAAAGVLHYPSAAIAPFAWRRRHVDQRAYSICGITHSIALDRITQGFADLLVAPLQPWDAVVCTSRAARTAVEALWDEWREYLRDRLSAADATPRVQLPIIPLGVDTTVFPDRDEAGLLRAAWRQRLGISADACVFLFRGRLDHRAKANPTAMYLGLERAAVATGRPVHLVHFGWFPDDLVRQAFEEAARALCPSVRCHFVDGRDPTLGPDCGIWYAADVFTSLSDNLQETFGLTPLEAMAAGLPVVVSDWDGYRDTVRDGVDGFTIPTLAPGPGRGGQLTAAYEAGEVDYDQYIGNASLATSVDVAAAARAYAALVMDQTLRRRMGEAGQRRARANYEWRVIIGRHQALWRELATMRRDHAAVETAPRRAGRSANPTRPDPFTYFRSFPARHVASDDVIACCASDLVEAYAARAGLRLNAYGEVAVGTQKSRTEIVALVAALQPCTVGVLLARLPGARQDEALRTLIWLGKLGLISLGSHNAG